MIILSLVSLFRQRRDPKTLIIILGTVIAAVSAIDDIMFYQFGRNFMLNAFRYSRMSVGISLMILFIMTAIINEFFRTQKELNETHKKLKETHDELKLIHKKLKVSERKYRHLSEGADQAIFSLSPDMKFMSMNRIRPVPISLFPGNPRKSTFWRSSTIATGGIPGYPGRL